MANGYSQIPTGRNTNTNGQTEVGGVNFEEANDGRGPGQGPSETDKGPGPVSYVDDAPTIPTADSLEGNINFIKKIYSKKALYDKLDTSFSELVSEIEDPEVDVSAFFRMYNNMFFEIPKTGPSSHTTLIQNSTDFVRDFIDPKDTIIEDLNIQIQELQLQLANPENAGEHPVFKNGTIVKLDEPHNWFYMDRGYRRRIEWNTDMVNIIKLAAYGDTSGAEIPVLTSTMMNSIPRGYPNLTEENFGTPFDPELNESSDAIYYIKKALDENGDVDIDPHNYDTKDEYEKALQEDLLEKGRVISKLKKEIRQTYNPQINTLKMLDEEYYNATYGSDDTGTTNGGGEPGREGSDPSGMNARY